VKRGVVSRAVADLTDILPTLAEFSGAKLPQDRPFDGHSLGPVLRGEKAKHRDWIYSHLDDGRVLRDTRWLLEIGKGGQGEKFYDCGDSRDGTGYRDVTHSDAPEVRAARASFATILATMPEPKPHEGAAAMNKKKRKGGAKSAPASPAEATANLDPRVARFGQRDRNGDGVIDHPEFMATLSGNDPAAGEARFRKFDANGDGRVTKEEFLADGAKGK
jgi:hypothetical protein